MSVLYEVNLAIDADIADAYVMWLVPHMQEMLALPGFVSAQLANVEPCPAVAGESAAAPRITMTATYVLESRAKLQEYFDVHAARLRGDGTSQFTGKFDATRRIHSNIKVVERA